MSMPAFDQHNNLVDIEIEDIFCIYKDQKTRKIIIRTKNGIYYFPSTIDEIFEIMMKYDFFQIDKNHVINVVNVKAFRFDQVYIDSTHYYVARRRRSGLQKLIENRSRNTNGKSNRQASTDN